MSSSTLIKSYGRGSALLATAILVCVVVCVVYGATSDKGMMTCTRDGSDVLITVNAPQGGCWLQIGFQKPGKLVPVEYIKPLQAGLNEGIRFPIDPEAKACMLNLRTGLNRAGECPFEKEGKECPVKAMSGNSWCFCRVPILDKLGWYFLRDD